MKTSRIFAPDWSPYYAGMIAASLSALQRDGAFMEVAKRDIWSPQRVAQERPDVRYKLIAIDFWSPEAVGANLKRLASMLAAGQPLPPPSSFPSPPSRIPNKICD